MSTRKVDNPALDQLGSTPEILRLLMGRVDDEAACRKAAPDRWSIAENLEHLSHIEGHWFRARLDQKLSAAGADIGEYDELTLAEQGTYSDRDPEESFAHWEEQREENIRFLRGLDAGVLSSAETLLNEWVCHDLGHVGQIAGLVRAGWLCPSPLQ